MERLPENMNVSEIELSEDDMAKIGSLNKNHRMIDPIGWTGPIKMPPMPYFY